MDGQTEKWSSPPSRPPFNGDRFRATATIAGAAILSRRRRNNCATRIGHEPCRSCSLPLQAVALLLPAANLDLFPTPRAELNRRDSRQDAAAGLRIERL